MFGRLSALLQAHPCPAAQVPKNRLEEACLGVSFFNQGDRTYGKVAFCFFIVSPKLDETAYLPFILQLARSSIYEAKSYEAISRILSSYLKLVKIYG